MLPAVILIWVGIVGFLVIGVVLFAGIVLVSGDSHRLFFEQTLSPDSGVISLTYNGPITYWVGIGNRLFYVGLVGWSILIYALRCCWRFLDLFGGVAEEGFDAGWFEEECSAVFQLFWL